MNTPDNHITNQEIVPSWQEDYLQEVSAEVYLYLKNFVGRQEQIVELEDWISTNSSGYLLLTSASGQGKSSLLAKFIQSQKGKSICLVHMVRRHKNPYRILQFLIWQVTQIFEESVSQDFYYKDINKLRDNLVRMLDILQQKKGKIIVLIDDLDELNIYNELIKLLPIKLPKNIYFILSIKTNFVVTYILEERLQNLTIKQLSPYNIEQNIPEDLLKINITNGRKLDFSLLLNLLSVSYEPLNIDELQSLLTAINIEIEKIELLDFISNLDEYFILLPNKKILFVDNQIAKFTNKYLRETKDIIEIYKIFIEWLNVSSEQYVDYYLNYLDCYLLNLSLIFLENSQLNEAKEIITKLVNLLTNIDFIINKIKIQVLEQLLSIYQKVISYIPISARSDNWEVLLTWFRFLDSENYVISQNPHLFLQQALNQPNKSKIFQAASKYLENLTNIQPYTYINWLNKPEEHIYKALKQVLITNNAGIQAIKLTSDNKYLISAGEDSKIKIWDFLTGQELNSLTGHHGIIFSLEISKDDKYIISGDSNAEIIIWHLTTGETLVKLQEHKGTILSLAISSNNQNIISASSDRTIKIWNFDIDLLKNTNSSLITLTNHNSIINALTITPDNQYIIAGSNDGNIEIYSLTNKNHIISIKSHNYAITDITVTSDNQYIISISEDGTSKIWNIIDKNLIAVLTESISSVNTLKITSDNQYIITGNNNKTINIWNLTTGLLITTLTGHNNLITDIEITSDDKYFLSTDKDGVIKLWDLSYVYINTLQTKQKNTISAVTIALDGSFGFSAENNGVIKLWDINNNCKEITILHDHQQTVNSIAITSDNKYMLSAGDDKTIKIWDLNNFRCIVTLQDHQERISVIIVTSDNKYIISAGDDKTIRIWDFASQILIKTLYDKAGIYALMLKEDEQQFISANFNGKIRLWDLINKKVIKEQRGCFDTKSFITKNGKYQVIGLEDNTLQVIDLVNDNIIASFFTISLITKCVISNNGIVISCDQLGNLYFLKLENFSLV